MNRRESTKKILTIPIRIMLVFLLYGLLFILMNWPFGHNILLISSIILTVLYFVRFINKKIKVLLDYVKLSMPFFWTIGLIGATFNLFHIDTIVEIILIVLTIWWLIEEGFSYLINRKLKDDRFLKIIYYLLLAISIVSTSFGYIFKIQHWPYGSSLFTLGILSLSFILILDLFAVKKEPYT